MKTAFTLALVLTMGMFVAASAQSEEGEHGLKKIEQFKKMKLLEVLDLDESTSNAFLAKYDKWERQILQMMQQRSEFAIDLKYRIERKAPDTDLNSLLDSLTNLSQRYNDTKLEMFKDIRTILTPRQAAKFVGFEIQFQRKLRESIDKLRDRHRPF